LAHDLSYTSEIQIPIQDIPKRVAVLAEIKAALESIKQLFGSSWAS
jgi:hypothetical protein